jgi:hypothetical protein
MGSELGPHADEPQRLVQVEPLERAEGGTGERDRVRPGRQDRHRMGVRLEAGEAQ